MGGCTPSTQAGVNWNRASQQGQTEKSRCSDFATPNHTRFHYIRSHFVLPRPDQTKNAAFLGRSSFFANYFWTKKEREKHETPSYSSRQDPSKHVNLDPERSIWKFDLRSAQWPDLINVPGRSYCISFDASWGDKHNDTSPTALWRICEELLT